MNERFRFCMHALTVLIVILNHITVECQSIYNLRSQIDKLIKYDTDILTNAVPGFIIGVIDHDSTYILPYGTRKLNTDSVLTENDVFELGSITKVMTAEIILRLYAEKKLDVDHAVNDFLPEEYRNPGIDATVRDLLMHRSGLPKIPETIGKTQFGNIGPYSGFHKSDLLKWYHQLTPGARGAFRYSHVGYALLELVIESVANEPFPKVFNRYITEKYGLSQTHAMHRVSLTPGFDLANRAVSPWSFQSFRGSEGAVSSLADLVTYVRVILNDNSIPLMWNTTQATDEKLVYAGPGWYRVLPKKQFPVYIHTGRTSGHTSTIAFSRQTQTAVIILANSSKGTDDLGMLILRMINRQWRRKG